MKNKITLIISLLFSIHSISAQSPDTTKARALTVWGFADFYYAYDFNKPASHDRPAFIYSHNRHNEFALNNGIIGLRYNNEKVRGAFAMHTGTYVRANYAAEPDLLKLIYEAYAGFSVTKRLWVDAGIFASHIGSESAMSMDNLTLSRSMMADNTPYYESGVKVTYTVSNKLILKGLVLNGWQNIAENNDNKAIGTQIQFKPTNKILLNSSTFIGKEKPGYDSLSSMRYFHNFYVQINFNKITVLAAFDIGVQEKTIGSGANVWYNPNFIVRLKVTDKIAVAARLEYYCDKHGVIIRSVSPNGFQTFSPSLNFDYKFSENVAGRIEGRVFNSRDKIFVEGKSTKNMDTFLLSSLAIKF